MTRKRILEILADYFIEKGEMLDKREYNKQDDRPIRATLVSRGIGSWARVPRMIERNFPDKFAEIGKLKQEVKPVEKPVKESIKKEKPSETKTTTSKG